MKPLSRFWQDWGKRLLTTSLVALLLLPLSVTLSGAGWNTNSLSSGRKSQLAQGDAITDPTAILRYALPIENQEVRQLQGSIEGISTSLRAKRWSTVMRDLKDAALILNYGKDEILADIPSDRQTEAQTILAQVTEDVKQLQAAAENKDKPVVWEVRRQILNALTDLEELMVTGFPFTVPEEYGNLPQLKGRATVEMETTQGTLTIIVDGYNAPVNAGNFVDLVQRGFYDGLDFFQREGFVVQTGNPPGDEEGFIDPKTGEYRAIPMEIKVQGDDEPIYGITLEDAGLYLAQPALPFNAYGALALARPSGDANGGSSQVFFFLFDRELTPPGYNLMDGRYSVFGYVVEGQDVLAKLTNEDQVIRARVIQGADNLEV
ncbi:peptidylprolyl isomerase [Spirulina subsalsa FACHB-351]|uniref:peptidylprolyl isomerase n=1 Tax=Spirulina subsalsa FACHB-351 TaxID=234711 RepID=A0ABT3L3Y9_9CYAN|nr:peptidylprolyl isomerase [Spirulina subsalsa]MCW6036213.1 peptidylprolyl isomerase [Spirulina subsalsa FACHB-351]